MDWTSIFLPNGLLCGQNDRLGGEKVDEILRFFIEAIVPAVGGYLWGQCRT